MEISIGKVGSWQTVPIQTRCRIACAPAIPLFESLAATLPRPLRFSMLAVQEFWKTGLGGRDDVQITR